MSHPSWVCGLKHQKNRDQIDQQKSHPSWVCGLKHVKCNVRNSKIRSHPSWVCGLKLTSLKIYLFELSHTLRGCVD